MSQPSAAPDPGWYPDSADPTLERWWDGSGWSPVTRPRDAARTEREGGQSEPPPGGPKPNPFAAPANPGAAPSQGHQRQGEGQGPQKPQGSTPSWARPSVLVPPATPDGVPLAAPGMRLVARIVDALITSVLTAGVGIYYLAQMYDLMRPQLDAVAAGSSDVDLTSLLEDPAFTDLMLRYGFVGLLVGGVYSVLLTRLFGGTLGKLLVGVRIRSWDEPGRPSWGQALARWLTREVIAQITFAGLGSLYWIVDSAWLLFDPRRQCLHDKLPATVVVRHS